MSGSPLLDSEGNLVGIHGMYRIDDPTIRKGSSYAIPINTYKELVAEQAESTDEVASQPSPVATKKEDTKTDNSQTISIQKDQLAQVSGPIETQPGPYGTEVHLLKVKVTGQTLHVSLDYLPPSEKKKDSVSYPMSEVGYIDDKTGKLYGVLKDESGSYIRGGDIFLPSRIDISGHEKRTLWFKFPAPSPETETISINIPGVGAFVGVQIQR